MTQLTDRSTPLSSASAVERGRAAALTASFLRGVIAAGLGLGALSVLVMALWISSPYPDSGAGGALRVAAALWLLAHGIELVRLDTLSGNPAPLGVVPLLLMALPVYLAYRAARDALEPDEGRPQLTALGAVFTVTGGYVLVGGGVAAYAAGGQLSARPERAAITLGVVALLSTAAGAWTAGGHRLAALPLPLRKGVGSFLAGTVWSTTARRRTGVALRTGAAATLLLVGGGALLVGVSLAGHGQEVQASFLRLAGDWSGRFAVALLALALVPNAAVWGAAYGLGPGFALGTVATATPLGVVGSPDLPPFPLLAGVPEGPGTALNWAVLAVPGVAGLAIGWFTVGVAAPPYAVREEAWGARATALTAAFGGAVCALLTAFLAAMAGGPVGNADLAALGPVWWLTGAAALVWAVGLGVPAALGLRAWRLRERRERRKWRVKAAPAPTPALDTGDDALGLDILETLGWGVGAASSEGDPDASEASGRLAGQDATRDSGQGSGHGSGQDSGQDAGPDGGQDSGHGSGQDSGRDGGQKARPDGGQDSGPYAFPPVEAWHERGAREARWAAIKEASGGLMADFTPTPPAPLESTPLEPAPAPVPAQPALSAVPTAQAAPPVPEQPSEPASTHETGSEEGPGVTP
ncbi:DUF6350 family protein [Streptomyces sp. NPDC051569]|uniref:cell division protein PerM n=1 Tax=Streptomyces sp. NPDC051569 TaxID=3365661 RepID=UPI0037A98532